MASINSRYPARPSQPRRRPAFPAGRWCQTCLGDFELAADHGEKQRGRHVEIDVADFTRLTGLGEGSPHQRVGVKDALAHGDDMIGAAVAMRIRNQPAKIASPRFEGVSSHAFELIPQRRSRRQLGLNSRVEAIDLIEKDLIEELFFIGKVIVNGRLRQPGCVGDFLHADVSVPALDEGRPGDGQNPCPAARRGRGRGCPFLDSKSL